jgi:hypothetical protein
VVDAVLHFCMRSKNCSATAILFRQCWRHEIYWSIPSGLYSGLRKLQLRRAALLFIRIRNGIW